MSLLGCLRGQDDDAHALVRWRFGLLSGLLLMFSVGAAAGATAEAHFGLAVIAIPLSVITGVAAMLDRRLHSSLNAHP